MDNNSNNLTRREFLQRLAAGASVFTFGRLPTLQQLNVVDSAEGKIELPFTWENGLPFYMSVRTPAGNLGQVQLMTSITYGEDDLVSLREGRFNPGNGNFLTMQEQYGNMFAILHSGWVVGPGTERPLEGEFFREELEGGLWDYVTYEPSREEVDIIHAQISQNIEEFIGSRVRLVQGTGADTRETIFEVQAVSYIPHEAIPQYEVNGHAIVDIAQQFDQLNADAWEETKSSESQNLIIATCGWGAETPETSDPHDTFNNHWSSWTRYAILLTPVNPTEG